MLEKPITKKMIKSSTSPSISTFQCKKSGGRKKWDTRFGGAPSNPGPGLPYTLTWFDGGRETEKKNHVNCNHTPWYPDHSRLQSAHLPPGSIAPLAGRTLPRQIRSTSINPCGAVKNLPRLSLADPLQGHLRVHRQGTRRVSPRRASLGRLDVHWGEKGPLPLRTKGMVFPPHHQERQPPRATGDTPGPRSGVADLPPAEARGGELEVTLEQKGNQGGKKKRVHDLRISTWSYLGSKGGLLRGARAGIPQVATA